MCDGILFRVVQDAVGRTVVETDGNPPAHSAVKVGNPVQVVVVRQSLRGIGMLRPEYAEGALRVVLETQLAPTMFIQPS
jgi:hypothetical protein